MTSKRNNERSIDDFGPLRDYTPEQEAKVRALTQGQPDQGYLLDVLGLGETA